MVENSLSLVRERIVRARSHEEQTHQLKEYLVRLLPQLHEAISLPEQDPAEALLRFVVRYIEHAPDFLQALGESLHRSGMESYGKVFIDIATEFFLQPPEMIEQNGGLKSLIDEAYLSHRLMEEINDRLLMLCGAPLAPMDTALANVVIHELLGEEFANQLDLAVHYAVEALFQSGNSDSQFQQFLLRHPAASLSQTLQSWPCLAEDSTIFLNLRSQRFVKTTEH